MAFIRAAPTDATLCWPPCRLATLQPQRHAVVGAAGGAGGYVRITQCGDAMSALERRAAAVPAAAALDRQQSRSLCFRCVSESQ